MVGAGIDPVQAGLVEALPAPVVTSPALRSFLEN